MSHDRSIELEIEQRPVRQYWKGRGGFMPVAIVEHMMQGSIEETWSYFDGQTSDAQARVSAHYGVARDGRVWQFVADEDSAWANGILQKPDTSLVWLKEVYEEDVNCNLVTLAIEYEGFSGEPLTGQQYQAAQILHRRLLQQWEIPPDPQHIIGHDRIDSLERAANPGPAFPWQRLFDDLKSASAPVETALELNSALAEPQAPLDQLAVAPAPPSQDETAAVEAAGPPAEEITRLDAPDALSDQAAYAAPLSLESAALQLALSQIASDKFQDSADLSYVTPTGDNPLAHEVKPVELAESWPEIVNLDVVIPFSTGVNDELEYARPAITAELDHHLLYVEPADLTADSPALLIPEPVLEDTAVQALSPAPEVQQDYRLPAAPPAPSSDDTAESMPFSYDPRELVDDLPPELANHLTPASQPAIPETALPADSQGENNTAAPSEQSDSAALTQSGGLPDFVFNPPNGEEGVVVGADLHQQVSTDDMSDHPLPGWLEHENQPEILYPFNTPVNSASGETEAFDSTLSLDGSLAGSQVLEGQEVSSGTQSVHVQGSAAGSIPDEFFARPVEEPAEAELEAAPAENISPAASLVQSDMAEEDAPALSWEDTTPTSSPSYQLVGPYWLQDKTVQIRLGPALSKSNEGWQDFLFEAESIFDDLPGELSTVASSSAENDASLAVVSQAGAESGLADLHAAEPALPENNSNNAPLSYEGQELSQPAEQLAENAGPVISGLTANGSAGGGGEPPVALIAADIGGGNVTVELANIRVQPSFDRDSLLRVAELGKRLSLDGWAEGPELQSATRWYHISPEEGGGWIHSKLVRLDNPFAP